MADEVMLVVSVGADETPATKAKTTREGDGGNRENVKFSTHRYLLRRKDFSCYNCFEIGGLGDHARARAVRWGKACHRRGAADHGRGGRAPRDV